MHTNHPKEDPLVDMGYEIRDVNAPAIARATVWFFVFAVVCFGGVLVWYFAFGKLSPNFNRDARKPVPSQYPLPQSNITTKTDIMDMRRHEEKVLKGAPSYVTTDKQFLRIPIDRAMSEYITSGYPEPTSEVPAKTVGNTIRQNALAPGETAPVR